MLCNTIGLYAQNGIFNENNEMKYKEEESYKSISFDVEWFDENLNENSLINLLKSNSNILFVEYNSNTKNCKIDSKLAIDKKNIIELLGPLGYKTSEYQEEVHLLIQMPTISAEDREKMQKQRDYDNWLIKNTSSDYPQFINTGNPEHDNEDFAKRKKEWVINNPEKYNRMISSQPSSEKEKQEIIEKNK